MSDEQPVALDEQPVVPEVLKEEIPASVPPEPERDWKAEAEKERLRAENYKREIELKGLREKKERVLPALTAQDGKFSEDQLVVVHNDYISKREDVFHELSSEISSLTEEQWNKAKRLLTPALDSVYSGAFSEGRLTARGEIKDALMDVVNYVKKSDSKPVPQVNQDEITKARLQGMKEQQQLDAGEIPGIRPRTPVQGQGSPVTDQDRKNSEETGRSPERESEIRLAKEKRAIQYAPRYSSFETE